MTTYIAYLRSDGDAGYTLEFPDLAGCVVRGANPGQLGAQAGDELTRHLTALMNFGYPAPAPSSASQLGQAPGRGGAELIEFEVDLELLSIAQPLSYHTL